MSTVKTIFKVLLGTVVIIVVSMSLIEVFNLSIYAIQLNKLCKTAAYQAASMFTQETYNAEGRNFVGTLDDIVAEDMSGNKYTYCSANFFYDNGSTYLKVKDLSAPDAGDKVYQAIFRNKNSEFYKFSQDCLGYASSNISNSNNSQFYAYTNLRLLAMGTCNNGKKFDVPKLTFSSNGVAVQQNQDLTQVNTYIENRYTPANLGIPFIDENVATNMFQYSLTKLLSGCDEDNIWTPNDNVLRNTTESNSVTTEDGKTFTAGIDITNGQALPSVYYHGFRCYVSDSLTAPGGSGKGTVNTFAEITNISYTTYDLTKANKSSTSVNKLPGRKEFEQDTGYIVKDEDKTFKKSKAPDIISVSETGSKGLSWSSSRRSLYSMPFKSDKSSYVYFTNENYDNALITVATIEYTVPMKYVGVTPIARVFNYIMGKSVVGLGDSGGTVASGETEYKYTSDEAKLDLSQSGNLYSGDNFTGDGELNAYYKSDKVKFMLID